MGFLTVLEDPQRGLVGGYLILNLAGRPVEFHCTAPVKPNRAQQILYGPTLLPFLYGEQIGQALLTKSGLEPLAVLTDQDAALAVGDLVPVPVVLVLPPTGLLPSDPAGEPMPQVEAGGSVWRVDSSHGLAGPLTGFILGRNRLAVPAPGDENRRRATERLQAIAESMDLAEPFGRIREAIEEARRGSP